MTARTVQENTMQITRNSLDTNPYNAAPVG